MAGKLPATKAAPGDGTEQFAVGVLSGLDVPITANNVANFETWLHQEQDASSWGADKNNPLGVENSAGVVAPAASFEDGIDLTVKTLEDGSYGNIVSALRQNSDLSTFAEAVITSPWSGGVYLARGGTGGLSNAIKVFTEKGALDVTATGAASTAGQSVAPKATGGPGIIADAEKYLSTILPFSLLPGAGAAASAVSGSTKFFDELTSAAFWKRIGVGAAGLALMALGLILFLVDTGSRAAQTTISSVPMGAMLAEA